MSDRIRAADLPPGAVRRVGGWAVGNTGERVFAASRRCRHQLADLSEGSVDEQGCLVCPWHQSRYDTTTGRMVEGPHGFLGYHGPAPGYARLVLAYARHLPLKLAKVLRRDGEIVVGD